MRIHQLGFIHEEASEHGDGGGADLGLPTDGQAVVESTTPPEPEIVTEQPELELNDEQVEQETPQFDPTAIGKSIAEELKPALQPVEQPKTVDDLTESEKAEMLNRMQFNEDFVQQMFGTYDEPAEKEQQLKALDALRQGVVNEAATIAQYLVQQQQEQLTQQLAPILQTYQEQQSNQSEKAFYDKYKALDDDNYRELTKMVATNVQQSGKEFASQEDYYQEIAAQSEAMIKRTVPNFSLNGASTPTKTTQMTAPASQQIGGQGGSGGAPRNQEKVTKQQHAANILEF
ncbi:MAG: hypothetical protein CMP14_00210 [Rickettsiales bacterium]|nr:hypothetical protein [Rickettsiales bacterium]|tara:strand:+ start:32 stop:895 length:864 start_codon:yes stop_codon:yes gene_type:complete